MRRLVGLVVGVALLAGACGGADGNVQVAAAADLRAAFEEMQPELEAACACSITFVFGSSGLLHEQIAAGAELAVYFSADEAFVRSLAEQGAVLPDSVVRYGVGRLVLTWREGIDPVRTVAELAEARLQRIAIANPGHAPYGRAARAALEQAGAWDAVEPRIVYGENIRQATDYVLSGDADAGIVALALLVQTETPYELVPTELHPPLVQAAGVVRGVNETAGRAIRDYVVSAEGQARLREYGFEAAP